MRTLNWSPEERDQARDYRHLPGGERRDQAKNYFPMPVDASGQDDVLAGRIRKDLSDPTRHSISVFVEADRLLKGAALNAVQIAERLPEGVMARADVAGLVDG